MKKIMGTGLIIILIMIFAFTISPTNVSAYDVIITSISPSSRRGKVGDIVRVVGTINTTDGLCQIWFEGRKINETRAVGNKVDVEFAVPSLPEGNHTLTLIDVGANANVTTWFFIETAYYIRASKIPKPPGQLQEGSQIEIMVNVTGGKPNTVYSANVTVTVPSPANETYWTLVKITTTNTGEGHSVSAVYPNDFKGNPHTNYVGTYTVAFNETLATTRFIIGLTDSTEYHRHQRVDIKASGYRPHENVLVRILYEGKTLMENNVNATENGLVYSSWIVPGNASIGTYTVKFTSSLTRKTPSDIQNFVVPGFNVTISARNLAGEPVPNVEIRVFEIEKFIGNKTSGSDGSVVIPLEIGAYVCRAFYRGVRVGENSLDVTGVTSLNVSCALSNLKILVVNENNFYIPEVQVYLKQENQTVSTDVNGTAVLHSLLPEAHYTLNLSRYNMQFNTTVISNLLVNGKLVAWFNITVTCPSYNLQVRVVKANGQPFTNALVKIQELMGGLYQEGQTDFSGAVAFDCTLGKYHVEVYDSNGIKLNGTNVDLFGHKNITIFCNLYGLTIWVRVVDYFGQPIQNVNVVLQREGMAPLSKKTQSDGTAIFDGNGEGIIGGKIHITTYLGDQLCTAEDFFVDDSTAIEVRLDKYVVLAGFPVEAGQFATLLIIMAAVILFLFIEFFRGKRLKF